MQTGLSFLAELSEADIDWILSVGTEEHAIANTVVTEEGRPIDSLYIVLDGLLNVSIASLPDQPLGNIGPGEIIGELSFLENTVASATVRAVESSHLLALPKAKMDLKLREDPSFAARIYRSFALLASRRLKVRVSTLGDLQKQRQGIAAALTPKHAALADALDRFKALMVRADAEALKNNNTVPTETHAEVRRAFTALFAVLTQAIGDAADESEAFKQEIGLRAQREILPYLLLTRTCERMYSKPRGYAGDFLTIEMMYENKPDGTGRLGPLLDECFLNVPAAVAVRNRRALLAESIGEVLQQNGSETARITTLACGPAEEVFDVFSSMEDKSAMLVNLIDIDMQALAFVADKRDRAKLQRQMNLINGNLLYLALGRQKIDVKPQHLIYSIGLIDYFNDNFVLKLLNYIHGLLMPGGKVILGNFHPKNPDKAMMDHLLDWKLTHRSEEDMNRLFAESSFKQPCSKIRFEPAGVNLFAECMKQ